MSDFALKGPLENSQESSPLVVIAPVKLLAIVNLSRGILMESLTVTDWSHTI